ncbi:outer membrane beta-barrel protein [Pontibacter qinzhouensis]|uniref:Outer membrane beta-barrel protein n=1 Tax=Pontibacter qinzhouensis TaxID=2603253 RepID=A0A5C8J7J1_9BACT|nr:outer membrane beta-barrel family protein [Pontibacter qinzhouensis]TXK33246.1 outer membrane beta-barrel protein [Pontibacter qinzhouensis]
MKKFYLFLLAFLLVNVYISCFAQSGGMLTGTVLDDKKEGVGFANVSVLNASTAAVVTGAVADMDGHFQIKSPAKGTYLLQISGLGFATYKTPTFEVSEESFSKKFGEVYLKSDAKVLQEVNVQALRPTIVTHPDKMVVSVEGTAMAEGSTAYEVLAKSPGVWVDQDGNIQLNGKSGVQIMINGKQTYMSGKDLQNLLQSMSAENLKDLEIITSPSARFDAAGASGVININLKKNALYGVNGSVYSGYRYNGQHTYTAGGNLNYKYGKWSSTASLDVARRINYRDIYMGRIFNKAGESFYFDQNGYEETKRFAPALRIGTDYDINDNHSIGFTTYLAHTNYDGFFNTDSYLRESDPANDLFVQAFNNNSDISNNGTFNLHYTGKLDSVGTTLAADLDYVILNSKDLGSFRNIYQEINTNAPATSDRLRSQNPNSYNIYSAKVDFTKTLWKNVKLETGAKASHVISDNQILFYQNAGESETLDPNRSNHFIYKENIFAAYTSFTTKFGKKWSVQAGLRAEQTQTEGFSKTTNQTTDRNYFDLFPTLFVQQEVSEAYKVGYKVNRRINRPYYSALNPFIFYLDPYTWSEGNPYLRPQYTNTFEITQTLKDNYTLVLSYGVTKDYMAEVPMQYSPEVTVFQQQNVENMKSAGATLILPVKVWDKWQINNTINGFYQEFLKTIDDRPVKNDQLTFMLQSNHNIELPWGLKMEVNGGYQGPAVYGLYSIKANWWLDSGLKRSFMNDKLSVALNFTDIFRTRELLIDSNINGNFNTINQYQGIQSVRLNLRYNFNKGTKFDAKSRNTNLDELNRTGN